MKIARMSDKISGIMRQLSRQMRRLFGSSWFCARGRHKPSRRRVKWVDGRWHSRCRNCDMPMLRLGKHIWIVVDEN